LAGGKFRTSLLLPPGITDGRPFAWAGMRVGVSYTYAIPLPMDPKAVSSSVRQKIRKAQSGKYSVSRSDDWAGILECLTATEGAKGFSHRIQARDLALGVDLMGEERFRGYLVRDHKGRPVSGGVRLHTPGHHAIDLVQGTQRAVLPDGANQLMYDFVLRDLTDEGATGFDLCGADIPAVAKAKSAWGMPLVPQLSIDGSSVSADIRRAAASSPFIVGMRERIRASQ